MKKLLIYLYLVNNLFFVYPNFASSKVVGEQIILGSVISLSGKHSLKGKDILDNFNIAIENINKKGGVKVGGKNYKFQLVYYDDESNPTRAAQIVKRLILQEGIQFILGPYSLELSEVIMPIIEKNRVLLVDINNMSSLMISDKYKYIFSVEGSSNPAKESANALLTYKEAIEKANSFDVLKIRNVLNIVIEFRDYLASVT